MSIQLRLPLASHFRLRLADILSTTVPSTFFPIVTEQEAVFPLLLALLEIVYQLET